MKPSWRLADNFGKLAPTVQSQLSSSLREHTFLGHDLEGLSHHIQALVKPKLSWPEHGCVPAQGSPEPN